MGSVDSVSLLTVRVFREVRSRLIVILDEAAFLFARIKTWDRWPRQVELTISFILSCCDSN